MNLNITRSTHAGKEQLVIKDASENIAYAVLRRFLPEQKDALTLDPMQEKASKANNTSKDSEPAENEPADASITTPEDYGVGHPPYPPPEYPPSEEGTSKERARLIIKDAQRKARTQFSVVANEMKDQLVNVSQQEESRQKHYKATIIEKNGLDLYIAEVICGACGHEGTRLTASTNRYVKCSACDQKLTVEPMYDEPLAANKAGHAFKANEPFVHYREQKLMRDEMTAQRKAE